MPLLVENHAAQRQPQNLQYLDMDYYDMANVHPPVPPLHEHRDQAIDNYAAAVLDVPAQAQAAPPSPVCTGLISSAYMYQTGPFPDEIAIFDGPAWDAAADPVQAFVAEWPPQGPVPNRPSNEVLRQLAILYLREPNSQVTVIRMEPGGAHGVKVFITLELANF